MSTKKMPPEVLPGKNLKTGKLQGASDQGEKNLTLSLQRVDHT
jgi:hypothetical protein